MKRKRKEKINWKVVRIDLEHYAPEIDGDPIVVTDDMSMLHRHAEEEHGINFLGLTVLQAHVDIRKFCSGVVKIKREVDRCE